MEESAWETGRQQRKKKVGVVGDKSRQGKGAEAGRESRDKDVDRERRRGGLRGRRNWEGGKKKSSGRQGAEAARGATVPAEIVQDAAGNLHPFGLHDEDPQQEQCIPAPRGRGPRVLQEDSGEHAAAAVAAAVAPTETRRGKGRDPLTSFRLPQPGTPRLGRGGGRSPESHAPALLERPNGKVENWAPKQAKQMGR